MTEFETIEEIEERKRIEKIMSACNHAITVEQMTESNVNRTVYTTFCSVCGKRLGRRIIKE